MGLKLRAGEGSQASSGRRSRTRERWSREVGCDVVHGELDLRPVARRDHEFVQNLRPFPPNRASPFHRAGARTANESAIGTSPNARIAYR